MSGGRDLLTDEREEVINDGSRVVGDMAYGQEEMAVIGRRRFLRILKEWRAWRAGCAVLEGGGRR